MSLARLTSIEFDSLTLTTSLVINSMILCRVIPPGAASLNSLTIVLAISLAPPNPLMISLRSVS